MNSEGMVMSGNILKTKSYAFALGIVKLYKYLFDNREYILSKQVLRSCTAIRAFVFEFEFESEYC
jgi:four helix bundle protein